MSAAETWDQLAAADAAEFDSIPFAEGVELPPPLTPEEELALTQNGRSTASKILPLPAARNGRIAWTNLDEIAVKPIRFADKPMWQHAAFHLVVGRKNSGKGTMLADLAARITRGELGAKRQVLWIANGEDSYAIDVKPRIIAAAGNPALVTVVISGHVRLPNDAGEIERKARELGQVGLIVIDPLGGSLTSGKSSNHDGDVRPALAPLNPLADNLDCIVAGVRHVTNKRLEAGALAGVLGSSDWVNVPRVVIAIVHDDEDDEIRHMQVVAGNRVKQTAGRIFRIEGHLLDGLDEEVTRTVWLGDSTKDASDLLATQPQPRAAKKTSVKQLILRELAHGPQQLETLKAKAAAEAGASSDTTWRAANELKAEGKVTYNNSGPGTKWYWRLTKSTDDFGTDTPTPGTTEVNDFVQKSNPDFLTSGLPDTHAREPKSQPNENDDDGIPF